MSCRCMCVSPINWRHSTEPNESVASGQYNEIFSATCFQKPARSAVIQIPEQWVHIIYIYLPIHIFRCLIPCGT